MSDQYIQTNPGNLPRQSIKKNLQPQNPIPEEPDVFRLELEDAEPTQKAIKKQEALSLHHKYGLEHDDEDELINRPSTRDPWSQDIETSKNYIAFTGVPEAKFRGKYGPKKKIVEQVKPGKKPKLPPFVYGNEPMEYGNVHLEVKGAQLLIDGRIYVGEWLGERMHGKGVLTDTDGGKYEGFFYENKKTGRGRYTYMNGEIYEGEWKDDEKEGYGTLYKLDGATYSGEWRKGVRHGFGEETFANKDKYIGFYENDKKHGTEDM